MIFDEKYFGLDKYSVILYDQKDAHDIYFKVRRNRNPLFLGGFVKPQTHDPMCNNCSLLKHNFLLFSC